MTTTYLWNPPPVRSLPVRGKAERLPINRIFCVGRNYHAHARRDGPAGRQEREVPFYFTKSPTPGDESAPPCPTRWAARTTTTRWSWCSPSASPPSASRPSGRRIVWGYACGLDMTRRDLQIKARDKGRPWDLGKDFEQGSVMSEVVPMPAPSAIRGRAGAAA
jgi:fumarylpyruvate hydrolase